MARRSNDAALKRLKEQARLEKQEAKRDRKAARLSEEASTGAVDEQALMEEFARISRLKDTDQMSTADYEAQRRRIFLDLGIEQEE